MKGRRLGRKKNHSDLKTKEECTSSEIEHMKKKIDDESQRVSGTDDEFLTLRLDKLG